MALPGNTFFYMARTVFGKEWCDALRDRRAMKLALMPIFYFVGIFIISFFVILNLQKGETQDGIRSLTLPVVGAENFPELMQWLQEQGANIREVEVAIYEDIAAGKEEFALVIPSDIQQQRSKAKTEKITLVYDASQQQVHQKLGFVRHAVNQFVSREATVNLLARGVSPELVMPIQLAEVNLASEQRMGIYVLGGIPIMLILSAFVASIGFSADMTAGERERRSLEALLITPATAGALMAGKWLTSFLITLLVVTGVVLALTVTFYCLPFSELGVRVNSSLSAWLMVWLGLVPLMALAVSLQLAISLFARSFKDAQTYTSLMIFIPMAATFYLLINPSGFAEWFYWTPVLGQHIVIRDVLLGGSVGFWQMISLWLTDLLLSLCLLRFAAGYLRSRRLVYS